MLEFCAAHRIDPGIEIINIRDVNGAYKKVNGAGVRFRFATDMVSLKIDSRA
jgi:uncharacterized zinc-type alcohol dehydrogenase-like protein